MNWNSVSVLVTGAGGFIGSTLVEALLQRGARVRAFVRYNSRGDVGFLGELAAELRPSLEIVAGDLRDASAVLRATGDVDTIMHLGALIAIPYSYVHPREVVETNVTGTLNVLEAARRTKPRRVVHTSTSEVYGTARYVPIDEKHPVQGQSPYSASKIAADKIVESYYRAFDVPAVTVRPFNTYGPRQSARAVIPTIITQALTRPEIRLGSLTPTRDLTYVDDTVKGFIRAAEAENVSGCEINLGINDEVSIGELVAEILRITGRSVPVVVDEARVRPAKSEVERLHSDNTLARELLGWTPAVPLSEGLGRTIDWIRENMHRYRVGEYQV
ncbi:MAG TPA: SDR family NAD(P)-dependent oxidoreductase [Thermoanaerobaculia bacterium]|nr:SDR family NAD(P)-dependent oxidoreductase [Thermoanaerobaculia bacterium]